MKKVKFLSIVLLIATTLLGQSPDMMSYQAVIRNSTNQLVINSEVSMRISILQSSANGTVVYSETHSTSTNANGLVNIEIGNGSIVSGSFSAIEWSEGPYFIKTETDPSADSGINYTVTGTSQLLSVPYSLYSKTAETLSGGISETDPFFSVSPSHTITADKITEWDNKLDVEVDGSVTNELQVLSISNDTIFLNNGGFVVLPGSSVSELASGDSLVLKDSSGTTRMIMNPNTGTFKMMNDDTVWYSLCVNSPPVEKKTNPDGSITERYGDGSYKTYFQSVGNQLIVEQVTKESNVFMDVLLGTTTTTTTSSKMNNGHETEKTTEQEVRDANGTVTTTTTERFDNNGIKTSESIVKHSYSGGLFIDHTETTNRTFDSSGNVLSENKSETDNSDSNQWNSFHNNFNTFSTSAGPGGFSMQGNGTNQLLFQPSGCGSNFTLGYFNGDNRLSGFDFYSSPIGTGTTRLWGDNVVVDAPWLHASGGLNVADNFYAGGTKNFRIDHPDFPESKYLLHASIESDEVLNQYSGNAITDSEGIATVTLPDYIQKITIDFRYQLTVIGQFAQAIVLQEIENNQFVIKTDKPDVKVSWEITGKRNDRYMIENPFKVVVDK